MNSGDVEFWEEQYAKAYERHQFRLEAFEEACASHDFMRILTAHLEVRATEAVQNVIRNYVQQAHNQVRVTKQQS